MITWLSKKHMRYDAEKRDVVLAYIAVGNVSELPSKYGIEGYSLHEGSKAWDISSGKFYGFIDNGQNGTWNEQTTLINPMVLKGRVDTVNDLPSNPEVGWVYMVGLSTDTSFQEYMYTADNRWEFIGYNTITIDSALSTTSTNPVQNKVVTTAINNKQNKLTFDSTPQQYSSNPVKSSGIYSAINAVSSILTPISESDYEALETYTNPVYFVYESL